jgi:hypothetical protein
LENELLLVIETELRQRNAHPQTRSAGERLDLRGRKDVQSRGTKANDKADLRGALGRAGC